MKLNKNVILILTLILGISLIGTASATTTTTHATIHKQTSIYTWQIDNYGYYKNSYIKISQGKAYVNGYVYGTNPITGKVQKGVVYSHRIKVSPLNSHVKIKKITIRSIGWPSGKYYYNTYTTKSNKLITPGKYKSFDKITVYYTIYK